MRTFLFVRGKECYGDRLIFLKENRVTRQWLYSIVVLVLVVCHMAKERY